MRHTKRTIALILSLMVILCGSVFSTIAYLTDTADVTNTFSVGEVDIEVDETRVNTEGVPVDGEGNPAVDEEGNPIVDGEGKPVVPDRTVDGNEYPMIPGAVYVKDPTMTVLAESEPAYYRMMVTINCMDVLQEIFKGGFLPENFVDGWNATIWPCVNIIDNGVDATGDHSYTYEFRYAKNVDASQSDVKLEPLFTKLNIPTVFDNEDVAALEELKIDIVGHAIQQTGFKAEGEKTAEDMAWAAFDTQLENEKG